MSASAEDYEVLREVWRIVERRDGCTYRTERVGVEWVPMGRYGDGADLIYAALPDDPDRPFTKTIRRKR